MTKQADPKAPKIEALVKKAKQNAGAATLKGKLTVKSSPLTKAREVLKKVLKEDHVTPLTESTLRESMPHIPIGAIVLDFLIGGRPNARGIPPCPGMPRARIVNLYGTAGAGKTTLALTVAASVCNEGGTCVYIDWENEVEPRYAEAIGVPVKDESRFLLMQPNTLEEGMKIMVEMARAGVDLIVVDSVGAGVPADLYNRKVEEEGDQIRIGLVAAKWSQFLPKFKSIISRSNTCVIGISQLRKKIGGTGHGPEAEPQGGEAWKFYSAVRMMLRVFQKEKTLILNPITGKNEEQVTSTIVLAKLDKCKVSDSVHHEQKFYLKSGFGIDNARSVIEIAIAYKIVDKSGAWYEWTGAPGGSIRMQGMNAFQKEVTARKDALKLLFSQVVPKLLTVKVEVDTQEEGAGEDVSADELFDDIIPLTDEQKAAKAEAETEKAAQESESTD